MDGLSLRASRRDLHPPVSDAIGTLTRLGYIVDTNSVIHVEGRPVKLVITPGGFLVAHVGDLKIPWRDFRPVLRPQPRPSFPPVKIDADGYPTWAKPKPRPDHASGGR